MNKKKALGVFLAGAVTGVGALAVGGIYASDSTIPYAFEDGQVISADVMNDLFGKIRNTTVGFEDASELTGSWNCTQYEVGGAPAAGMPNSRFTQNATTKVWSASNVWSFSQNGTKLNVTDFLVGTMMGANNTGVCALNTGNASYNYSVTLAEGYLLLGEQQMLAGCTTTPVALPVQKISSYKFKYLTSAGFGVCVAQNQPPNIPTDLALNGSTLTWTDTSNDETGFAILRKDPGQSWTEVGQVGAGVTTYTDSAGQSRSKYRVKARNSNGDSLGSNVAIRS